MTLFEQKAIKYVPRLMVDLNLTRVQACGIFGNLGTETGGFTALQEKKPLVAGSRGGYGWMQWTGPRRRKYEEWAKANKLNVAEDETNYKYLVKETLTDEFHSLVQLRKTTTVEAATETFCKLNLRPGIVHMDNRIKWGRKAEEATRTPVAETAVTAGPVGGAVIAMTQTEPKYWIWIALAAAVIGIGGFILIRKNKEANATPTPELIKPKKGNKKNGQG